MTEIIILGTACMQPTKERNHVGNLLSYKNEKILFDCGENIQRQLRVAGIKPAKITKIFISHWHGDHVLGLPGLINSMSADKSNKRLEIYGPKGTKKYLKQALDVFAGKHIIKYIVAEIEPKGNKLKKISFPGFHIEAGKLKHGIDTLGYSFIEQDKRRIKSRYIKIIPGIKLGKLQRGKNIQHKSKKFTSKEATHLIKGKKITFIMDTRPCKNIIKLANEADILVSEATYLEDHKEKAKKYLHMTAKEAAKAAKESKAKKLILLHFSPRYKNTDVIEKEAKKVFKKTICAKDFMSFKL